MKNDDKLIFQQCFKTRVRLIMIIRKLERGDEVEVEVIIKDLAELKLVGVRVLCEAEQYIIEIPQATRRLFEQIKRYYNGC